MNFQRFGTILFASLLSFASSCGAQNFGAFDFFRGMIDAARLEQAREAWLRMPDAERACLERGLASRNTDIQTLIGSGVLPHDYRLKSLRSRCRQFAETALKRDFPCEVPDEDGRAVATTCNQSFAREETNGKAVPITPKEAESLQFGGTRVTVTNVETDQGRNQRRERAEARGRAEQLAAVKAELSGYEISPLPAVRREVARLRSQIEQQLAASSGPDAQRVIEIARDVKALSSLAEFESARVAAMRQLSDVRAKAEAVTPANAAEGLKSRLISLRRGFAGLFVEARPKMAPQVVGPSFDCARAVTSLPLLICGDKSLRVVDLEMARAFYVLRQQFSADTTALEKEADELSRRAVTTCRIPSLVAAAMAASKKLSPCVAAVYRRQTQAWGTRIGRTGTLGAKQEASRALAQHVRLQGYLHDAGVLAGDAALDGLYGSVTRQAIVAFAAAEGLTADGFMSDAVAERLVRRYGGIGPRAGGSSGDPAQLAHINALTVQYNAYIADLAAAESDQAARTAARLRLGQYRATLVRLLAGPLQSDLRKRLAAALRLTAAVSLKDQQASLQKLDALFDELRPRIEIAEEIAKAVSNKNRFVFEGDPQDVLIFFNSSPTAGGVARGLDGNLTFDQNRTLICSVRQAADDAVAQEQIMSKFRSLGIPPGAVATVCDRDKQLLADVLVFQRDQLPEEPESLLAIASAIDKGQVSSIGTLPAAQIRTAREAEKIKLTQVEAEVTRGTSEVLAMLALDNGSHTICRISDGAGAEFYAVVLKPYAERLSRELQATDIKRTLKSVYADANEVFLSAKRGKCGAVYGNAKQLSAFVKALARDQISFRYLPILISPEEVAEASRALAQEAEKVQRERERQAALRAQQLVDQTRQSLIEELGRQRIEVGAFQKMALPADIVSFLNNFSGQVAAIKSDAAIDRLNELKRAFADMKPRIEEAVRLARTDRAENRSAGAPPALVDTARAGKTPTTFAPSSPSSEFSAPPASPASKEQRIALVIGNSHYRSVSLLPNPENDANAIAGALREVGFTVTSRNDLSREAMIDALKTFASAAETADWAVIYFAGHGIEMGGNNYLIPVDAKLDTATVVGFEAVDLTQMKAAVAGARKLGLIILDACRANPFARKMRVRAASRAPARGLARPPEIDTGILIVYSAKDGEEASDGVGSGGSPFATALVKEIRVPGLEVRRLFDIVRDDVMELTGRNQQPYTYGSLSGSENFFFRASR